ncbi:MAG: phosphate ABC transporter permease PstA [Candidatus Thermoplasmatota archaeon]|nr:phosphate ABC transporter permease PstA [Candidatus Thermoplasmatota archaeon]
MEWSTIKNQLVRFVETITDKEKFTPKNVLASITIIYSLLLFLIGFGSTIFNLYIGDGLLQILLFIITALILIQSIYAFIKSHVRLKLLSMILFSIILILSTYYLPALPPSYDLRSFDISAAFLKFLIVSVFLMVIGILSVNYSFKFLYDFGRKSKQYSAYFILFLSVLIVLYPLFIIVSTILINGAPGITWEFLTEDVSRHGAEGGIVKNIIGTISLIIGVGALTLPLGIGAAVYLTEYAKGGIIVRIIRITVDILQGIPSIVFGLFAYALLVSLFGFCLLNGILVLTFLTLPIIIRTSEEAILSVPKSIREGSYALGASKWQTIKRIVLPPALPGIITGGVLGLGRAAGETAPILFLGAVFIGAPMVPNLFAPFQALPYHLLQLIYYIGAYEVEQNAWATAFLLLAIVLGLNAIAIILREKYRVEF